MLFAFENCLFCTVLQEVFYNQIVTLLITWGKGG